MNITTKYQANGSGTGTIIARGLGGKQKTTRYDPARSIDANHGIAAANLILHVQRTSPELQYGDNIATGAVASLNAGYGEHHVIESGRHRFSL